MAAATRSCVMNTLQAKNIQNESVDISWEPNAGVAEYTVEYKSGNQSAWVTLKTKLPYLTISNLQAGTTYEIKVKTDCWNAVYSNKLMVSTQNLALRRIFEKENITVYPNPVSDIATISIEPYYEWDMKISILDITGQVRFNKSFIKMPYQPLRKIQLDFSFLPEGIYFISFLKNGYQSFKKVIKIAQ